jgi:hypothetical protein
VHEADRGLFSAPVGEVAAVDMVALDMVVDR